MLSDTPGESQISFFAVDHDGGALIVVTPTQRDHDRLISERAASERSRPTKDSTLAPPANPMTEAPASEPVAPPKTLAPSRVDFTGRIGRLPTFTTTPRGKRIGRFPVITRRQDDDDRPPQWVMVAVFNALAREIEEHLTVEALTVGSEVRVIGYPQTTMVSDNTGGLTAQEVIVAAVVKKVTRTR